MKNNHKIISATSWIVALGIMGSSVISNSKTQAFTTTFQSEDGSLVGSFRGTYTTVNDPNNYVVAPGVTGFDGVADLGISREAGNFRCTGALLSGGFHVLTAAHCLTDESGNFDTLSVNSNWALSSGSYSISSENIYIHPDWDGNFGLGNDLAIIQLSEKANSSVQRYDLYTNNDEVGKVADKVGYGRSGRGDEGFILNSGTKRAGVNRYDTTHDLMNTALRRNFLSGAVLQYDFDNGLSANDGFGFFFGLSDLGEGENEVMSAPGDSGGPSFIDGKLAGISSYISRLGLSDGRSSDINAGLDSSFGEFAGDTRVSFYQDWITQTVAESTPVPEPMTILASTVALGFGTMFKRKRLRNNK